MNQPTIAASRCKVSIVIKALNEEKRIALAIESALQAVLPFDGEVILADSLSIDQTTEIARRYPISIVQLVDQNERCCGIGPQIGFQYSVGEYVYILDGDMEMLPGFMDRAVSFLDANPELAGVGGQVVEMNTDSLEYIARTERSSDHMRQGEVDRLDGGGLYRRNAIEQVDYFSNRNLHSYEEYDLGVRLRVAGWKLQRINVQSVRHYGHDADPYTLLLKRWSSGYICGLGEMLRNAVGEKHFMLIAKELRELKIYTVTFMMWIGIFFLALTPISVFTKLSLILILLCAPVVLMGLRKRSISKAIYSVISWHVNTAGLIRGLLHKAKNPRQLINVVNLSK
jgi:glycosyltransferase involved in cell wall biosynthesis